VENKLLHHRNRQSTARISYSNLRSHQSYTGIDTAAAEFRCQISQQYIWEETDRFRKRTKDE
jgi:hypothetical protein